MSEHTLKVAPAYWDHLVSGAKTFEARRNDRAYQTGDTLILRKAGGHYCTGPHRRSYCLTDLDPEIRATVTFVFSGDPSLRDCGGIVPGYVVLGLNFEGVTP